MKACHDMAYPTALDTADQPLAVVVDQGTMAVHVPPDADEQ